MPDVKRARASGALSSSVTGAGGGTTLLLYAQSLPESYGYKHFLVIAAPSISVFLGAATLYVPEILGTALRGIKMAYLGYKVKKLESDPTIPSEDKKEAREKLNKLKKDMLFDDMEGVRVNGGPPNARLSPEPPLSPPPDVKADPSQEHEAGIPIQSNI